MFWQFQPLRLRSVSFLNQSVVSPLLVELRQAQLVFPRSSARLRSYLSLNLSGSKQSGVP